MLIQELLTLIEQKSASEFWYDFTLPKAARVDDHHMHDMFEAGKIIDWLKSPESGELSWLHFSTWMLGISNLKKVMFITNSSKHFHEAKNAWKKEKTMVKGESIIADNGWIERLSAVYFSNGKFEAIVTDREWLPYDYDDYAKTHTAKDNSKHHAKNDHNNDDGEHDLEYSDFLDIEDIANRTITNVHCSIRDKDDLSSPIKLDLHIDDHNEKIEGHDEFESAMEERFPHHKLSFHWFGDEVDIHFN